MASQPIPVSQANTMIQEYDNYMTSLNVNGQTESVSFESEELLKWMSDVEEYSDEFRIFFGVYPTGSSNAGRLTTIIWPYKNGNPATQPSEGKDGDDTLIKPYNIGELHP